jgi:hypothetical protein
MRLVLGAALAVILIFGVRTAKAIELYEGTYSVPSFHGTFIQWGGTASVSAITHQLHYTTSHSDTILLHDGIFYSGRIDFAGLYGYANLSQNGGRHVNTNGIVLAGARERYANQLSSYTMNAGYLTTPYLGLPGGSYTQTGGTNVTTTFTIAAPGRASMEDGTLRTRSVSVSGLRTYEHLGGTSVSIASYSQSGGTTLAREFVVAAGANARVDDGTLSTSKLTVSGVVTYIVPYAPNGGRRSAFSQFEQFGGTTIATEFIVTAGAFAFFIDGTLRTSNLTMSGIAGTNYPPSLFEQFDGSVIVDSRLNIDTEYYVQGGTLDANTIVVGGHMAIRSPENVTSQRLILAGGRLETHGSYRLGHLELQTNGMLPTVSELIFQEPGTVQFHNSRNSNQWSPRAYLVVRNWQGSPNGGGEHQFQVGNSTTGLSHQQLTRILFENPANLPPGYYSARILATGEIVPNYAVQIGLQRLGKTMLLTWREPCYLETTTNLASSSQWTRVTELSPLAVEFSEPQRYFRLRRY